MIDPSKVLPVQFPRLGVQTWPAWREFFATLEAYGRIISGEEWDYFSARMFERVRAAGR